MTNPVGEPLLVIILAGGLERVNGEISGQTPADQVGHGLSEAEHVEEDEDDRAGQC